MSKYFGTDGFRGEAGITLTADHAYKVGRFLGWYYNALRERNGDTDPARIVIGKDILSVTESASAQERIAESANYILHNWMPARTRLCHDDHLIGCSAEGHVSHVLSDRMSSRPLGWCRDGANQMAHLRAYYFNKGNMLELVKAQKFPKAAGAEDTFIIDPHKLGETMYSEWGKYVDHANHEVSEIAQKFAWFNAGITLI